MLGVTFLGERKLSSPISGSDAGPARCGRRDQSVGHVRQRSQTLSRLGRFRGARARQSFGARLSPDMNPAASWRRPAARSMSAWRASAIA